MANPIVMPRLGDFMTEGTISKWHRSSGDTIKQGEVIAEIESVNKSLDRKHYISLYTEYFPLYIFQFQN